MQYIASHPDLIQTFGANAAAGQQHYLSFGGSGGRVHDDFKETQYLANYADLQAAFGSDTGAATIHYVQYGFAERATPAPTRSIYQFAAKELTLTQSTINAGVPRGDRLAAAAGE